MSLWNLREEYLCIGLLINGLFFKSAAKAPATPAIIEKAGQHDSLRSGGPSNRIPSAYSVTEETTRHLSGADLKE